MKIPKMHTFNLQTTSVVTILDELSSEFLEAVVHKLIEISNIKSNQITFNLIYSIEFVSNLMQCCNEIFIRISWNITFELV